MYINFQNRKVYLKFENESFDIVIVMYDFVILIIGYYSLYLYG